MDPLRIAHLTATFPPYWGGTGTVAYHVAAGQAERGHDVHVFTGTPGSAQHDPPGVTMHRLEPVFEIGNAPFIPSLARLRGFDLVHFHHPFIFGTEMVLLGRLRRDSPAVVMTYQNRLIGERERAPMFWTYEETVVRLMGRLADRVCLVSLDHGDSVNHLRAGRRRRPERYVEVPNGVDTGTFRPASKDLALRAELDIPADATVAVFAAALDRAHHFKRADQAIEALARANVPDLFLVVVGGGDLLEDYRTQAARAGVADRVRFAGPQPHERLPSFMHAADFFVLATEPPESFGIVIAEAMATALPAIASDIPGVRTLIEDGISGRLVPRGDVDALAAAMRELATMSPEERARMGAAGRAHCERKYAWPVVLDVLDGVYADALASRTTRGSSSSAA